MANQGRSSLVWFALAAVVFLLVAGCNGFWVNATLTSITLSSNLGPTPTIQAEIGTPPTCPAGSVCTVQMLATGTFNDGTTGPVTAFWSTSDATIAAINSSTGLVTGVATGTATITASSGTISGTASVTVALANLASITVNPTNPTLSSATGFQLFTATGNLTGGGTVDLTSSVTWTSSNTAVATITSGVGNNPGKATFAGTTGQTTIKAASGTISGTTLLTFD